VTILLLAASKQPSTATLAFGLKVSPFKLGWDASYSAKKGVHNIQKAPAQFLAGAFCNIKLLLLDSNYLFFTSVGSNRSGNSGAFSFAVNPVVG
jgi:hypothetical protein